MNRPGFLRLACTLLFSICALSGLRAVEDDRPVVNDSGVAPERPAGALPTLWIAGDSTVRSNAPMRGWGQDLARFFDPGSVNVVNRAIGGRSSRTFYTEGRWQAIVNELKAGDWVLIQFGHNDVGHIDARSKFRGSVKGIGDESEIVTKPDGSTEVVQSFGWYLKTFVRTARVKGANVVLCSPIPHKNFDDQGRIVRDWAQWRGWIADCAKSEGACYVDLCELITRRYEKMPGTEIESFFADKRTHTSAEGALFNARVLVSGLRALPRAPLDHLLSGEGKTIDPAR